MADLGDIGIVVRGVAATLSRVADEVEGAVRNRPEPTMPPSAKVMWGLSPQGEGRRVLLVDCWYAFPYDGRPARTILMSTDGYKWATLAIDGADIDRDCGIILKRLRSLLNAHGVDPDTLRDSAGRGL
jgi:hypothetical protein